MAETELMDSTAAKIVLAVQSGDSIHRISEKIGISYSWVYNWIDRLADKGIIANDDDGIRVVDTISAAVTTRWWARCTAGTT